MGPLVLPVLAFLFFVVQIFVTINIYFRFFLPKAEVGVRRFYRPGLPKYPDHNSIEDNFIEEDVIWCEGLWSKLGQIVLFVI